MTVCIAGISADPVAIVAVTDMKVSTDESSTEGAIKIVWLTENKRWLGMYAGLPTEFFELRRHLTHLLAGVRDPTVGDMKQAAEDAHLAVIRRKVQVEILGPRGLNLNDLNGGGSKPKRIDGRTRMDLLEAIEAVGLDTEIIIAGFDPQGRPHLITTSRYPSRGRMNIYDALTSRTFHAIGTGAIMAVGWLSAHGDVDLNATLPHLAFRMIEAKYFAEQGSGVGAALSFAVLRNDGAEIGLIIPDEATIRGAYKRRMTRPPAPDAMRVVESLLPRSTSQVKT